MYKQSDEMSLKLKSQFKKVIKNLNDLYIYTMEYYPAIKKNKIMPFTATWMEIDSHTAWSKSERDKYCMIPLISGI